MALRPLDEVVLQLRVDPHEITFRIRADRQPVQGQSAYHGMHHASLLVHRIQERALPDGLPALVGGGINPIERGQEHTEDVHIEHAGGRRTE